MFHLRLTPHFAFSPISFAKNLLFPRGTYRNLIFYRTVTVDHLYLKTPPTFMILPINSIIDIVAKTSDLSSFKLNRISFKVTENEIKLLFANEIYILSEFAIINVER